MTRHQQKAKAARKRRAKEQARIERRAQKRQEDTAAALAAGLSLAEFRQQRHAEQQQREAERKRQWAALERQFNKAARAALGAMYAAMPFPPVTCSHLLRSGVRCMNRPHENGLCRRHGGNSILRAEVGVPFLRNRGWPEEAIRALGPHDALRGMGHGWAHYDLTRIEAAEKANVPPFPHSKGAAP